jgi:MYXO-CTERM domain-containing protein
VTATPAGCSPGEMPRSRDFTWFMMALAAGAFLGYYFLM